MFSNLTPKEEFHLTGTLRSAKIESLLEKADKLETLADLDAHIGEAAAQYPAEDFLHDVRLRLVEFSKRLRGANRAEANDILEMLTNIGQDIYHATEYGRDELRKATEIIESAC